MKLTIVSLLILLILGVAPAFSQQSDKDTKLEKLAEESRRQDFLDDQAKLREDIRLEFNRQNSLTYKDFGFKPDTRLVPAKSDSWVLHIVTTGGFSGLGKPTVTLSSKSEFTCGESKEQPFQPFVSDQLQPLTDLIGNLNFTLKDLPTNQQSNIVCNDCYQNKVILMRREKNGKVKTYETTSNKMKYRTFAENFDLIKQNAAKIAVCQ
ncbi:MAG: hypothetical protein IPI64_12890 [Chloracidobacterium sp.]|nr:hypothetical protein [Chloracidobacterium sp.]